MRLAKCPGQWVKRGFIFGGYVFLHKYYFIGRNMKVGRVLCT